MGWRNPLEEDFSFPRIHIGVNPSGPSGQTLLKCNQSIHVLEILATFLYVIPSATKTRRRHPVLFFSYNNNIIKLNKNVWDFSFILTAEIVLCGSTNAMYWKSTCPCPSMHYQQPLSPVSWLAQFFLSPGPPDKCYESTSPTVCSPATQPKHHLIIGNHDSCKNSPKTALHPM